MFEKRVRSRRDDPISTRRRNIFWGVFSCVIITLILWGVWTLTRMPAFTIQEVTVEGGDTISHETIITEVDEILNGDYLKLIPHRFFLFYPHDELTRVVLSNDRVHTAQVIRKSRTSIHVTFTEYTPFALWCEAPHEEAACNFLDMHGYAFAPSPLLQGNTLTRHVIEGEIELSKKQVFDETSFAALHIFLEQLNTILALRVHDVYHTKEGDLTLYVNGGGKIYMRDDKEYAQALKNLETVLLSKDFAHLEPGNFQYIDIRFGNKVFVNEEPPETESATTSNATSTLGE